MAETTEAPAQAETQTDGAGTRTRKKRSLKGCFFLFIFLLLLIALALGAVYLLNKNSSDQKFNDYLAKMNEDGELLTVDEVVQNRYALMNAELDTTTEWRQAVETFNSDDYTSKARGMSLVGDDTNPQWPPAKWRDYRSAVSLIKQFEKALISLQLATAGYAFWSDDYLAVPNVSPQTIDGLRRAFDFLELSCYVSAHEARQDQLVLRLVSLLTFSNSLSKHPGHVKDCLEMERRALLTLMRAVAKVGFSEAELSKFRDLLANRDDWKPVLAWWEYQQAMRLLMYNDLERFRQTAFFAELQNEPNNKDFIENLDYTLEYSPFVGDDGVLFLELMKKHRDLLTGNPIEQAGVLVQLESPEGREIPEGLDKYRYPTAHYMVPRASVLVLQTGNVATHRNVALAMLAVDNFRVLNDQLPGALSTAMDDFLEQEPVDLFRGEPVYVIRDRDAVQVMSFGPDKIDNRMGQDDIGFAIPLEKFDVNSGPLDKVD